MRLRVHAADLEHAIGEHGGEQLIRCRALERGQPPLVVAGQQLELDLLARVGQRGLEAVPVRRRGPRAPRGT